MEPYMGLKAGDKVFVLYYTGKTLSSVVESVTPKGFVKVKGILYDQNGIQRGEGGWYKSRIKPASEEDIQKYAQECFINRTIYMMHKTEKITYEQAVAIDAILNG